jgi:hypothetical protein
MNQVTHEQRFRGDGHRELRKRIVKQVIAFEQGKTGFDTIEEAIMTLRYMRVFEAIGLATLEQVAEDYRDQWLLE